MLKWPTISNYFFNMESGKPYQIARPLPLNKMCGFREGYAIKNFKDLKKFNVHSCNLNQVIVLEVAAQV